MLHKLKNILNTYGSRVGGLLKYIYDYKILFFSIIYILLTILFFKILRNANETTAMGLVMVLFLSFSLILFLKSLLRNMLGRKRGHKRSEKEPLNHVYFFGVVFSLLLIALLCFSKIWFHVLHSREVDTKASCFTEMYASFEAVVIEEPDKRHRDQLLTTSPLQDISVGECQMYSKDTYILIRIPNYIPTTIGQVCSFSGTLVQPENFSDFNYKQYLQNKNIYLILEDAQANCYSIDKRRGGNTIKNILIDFKTRQIQKVDKVMQEPQSSLLVGILFGQKRLFSEQFDEDVRISGVSHIVAASGYNITILVVLINKILFFLPKKCRIILGLIVIWLFSILSGFSSSIVRACIMSSLSLIAIFVGRSNTIHLSLPLASAIFVFFDPLIIYDVGFILSISATLGLVYVLPVLVDIKEKITKGFKIFDDYVFPTMSCTLSTLPVSIITFGTFSIWSIPVNTVVLPVIESTMLWGVLSILLVQVHQPLSFFFSTVVNLQLKYFEKIVNLVGSIGWGSWEIQPQYMTSISLSVLFPLLLLTIYLYPLENEKYNHYLRNN